MTYNVTTLWIIYIVVLVVFFIVCAAFMFMAHSKNYALAFFAATMFGLIAVLIGSFWIDFNNLSNNDKTWLTILYVVAFVLPLIGLIAVFLTMSRGKKMAEVLEPHHEQEVTYNKEVDCNLDSGVCDIKEKKVTKDGENVLTEKVKGSTMNWGVLSDEKMRRNHYL